MSPSYKVIVSQTSPGSWSTFCQLCNTRMGHRTYDEAVRWANEVEPRWRTHQRWVGLLEFGGELPPVRGDDHWSSMKNRVRRENERRERAEKVRQLRPPPRPVREPVARLVYRGTMDINFTRHSYRGDCFDLQVDGVRQYGFVRTPDGRYWLDRENGNAELWLDVPADVRRAAS